MKFDYSELKILAVKLISAEAEFKVHPLHGGMQIIGVKPDGETWDAILHESSYGHEQNLLEVMGLNSPNVYQDDDVAGWLTGDQVFALWWYTFRGDDSLCKMYFEGE